MRPKYFLVYWSTYDYRWHIYCYFNNKKHFKSLVKCLYAEHGIDGDPDQFDPRMMTDASN